MIQKIDMIGNSKTAEAVKKAYPSAFCGISWIGDKIGECIIYINSDRNPFAIVRLATGKTEDQAWENALDEVGKEMLRKLETNV